MIGGLAEHPVAIDIITCPGCLNLHSGTEIPPPNFHCFWYAATHKHRLPGSYIPVRIHS